MRVGSGPEEGDAEGWPSSSAPVPRWGRTSGVPVTACIRAPTSSPLLRPRSLLCAFSGSLPRDSELDPATCFGSRRRRRKEGGEPRDPCLLPGNPQVCEKKRLCRFNRLSLGVVCYAGILWHRIKARIPRDGACRGPRTVSRASAVNAH